MTGMVKQKVLEELNRSGNIAGPFLRLIERVVAVKILITFLKYLDLVVAPQPPRVQIDVGVRKLIFSCLM